MKLYILALAVFLIACSSPQACTEEAKLCPDGSSVGRTGSNCEFAACPTPVGCTKELKVCSDGSMVGRTRPDCAFEECPTETCNYDDPAKPYLIRNVAECSPATMTCLVGQEYFVDDCGCGCAPVAGAQPSCNYENPEKSYVGKSQDACSRIKFMCVQGKAYFSDACGCGCSAVQQCTPQSRNAGVCTADYAPVCATVQVQCIRAPCPPVEQTFSNACEACKNSLVDVYTTGECPKA